ncbi:TPA: WxL domain-containing protein, partial [Enterococcus faecalis]|nr:WxL domain-containing protein [Enterococcus faecalis]
LQAQLVWDNNALKGSYIQTNNGKGEVKKNTNTGSADFQLNDLIGNDETVTGEANVKIGTTPTPIMTGQNVSHNGVYDYDLGQLSLVLENANTIQAGTYTGNINWNLTSAP